VGGESYTTAKTPQAKVTKPGRPTNVKPAVNAHTPMSATPTNAAITHRPVKRGPIPKMKPNSIDGKVNTPNTKSDSGWIRTVNQWETD
jgi:hypothetical protein